MKRQAAERLGRSGETIAAFWLRLHGWRILDTRVRTPMGEIDLVARRGKTIAFIEVKTRANAAALAIAIDRHRLKRVAAAANALATRYARHEEFISIDVVLIRPWAIPRHIRNAWQ